MTKRRALVIPLITLVIMTTLAAMAPAAHADGGDFSLDFIAAGPFTYNHDTGVGGEYNGREISKTEGVVESLEGGDFECGDKVVYFTAITVADGAETQDIELDFGFLAEPTGQPGVGHDLPIVASPNEDDSGMAGGWEDTTASIVPGTDKIDESGSNDEVIATVAINNLDGGEVFILRLVLELTCIFDSDPTGNLQGEIHAGRVVDPVEDVIPVGNQTVPFQSLSAISQPATISVSVGACPAPGSPTRPVTIGIDPPGSATVTITGPGGPYVITGDGDTLDLAPGNYSWTAAAALGWFIEGPASGSFTVGSCPRISASASIEVGACPRPGSPTRPVTVTIDGPVTLTIEGPGGPYEVTETDTLDLEPGDYTWSADVPDTHRLEVDSGEFTVASCPRLPASVSVEVGACPAPGSATRPVIVTIDGPVTLTIEGPGGPYVVTETDTLDLAPGDYTWSADVPDTHALEVDSGEFTVGACPAIEASVTITVGACPAASSTTKSTSVAINPDGGASVEISGPNGYQTTVTGSGTTLDLAQGTYTWSATANPTYQIIGASSGSFVVGSCVVQVLPKTILPKTGTELPGVGMAGFAFVLLGFAMVTASRRAPRAARAAGVSAMVTHLSGRRVWTTPEPRFVLRSLDLIGRRRGPRTWAARRRETGSGRAGPSGG